MKQKTYQVIKYVKATSAAQAIKKERDAEVHSVVHCKHPAQDELTPLIGFTVDNPVDEDEE